MVRWKQRHGPPNSNNARANPDPVVNFNQLLDWSTRGPLARQNSASNPETLQDEATSREAEQYQATGPEILQHEGPARIKVSGVAGSGVCLNNQATGPLRAPWTAGAGASKAKGQNGVRQARPVSAEQNGVGASLLDDVNETGYGDGPGGRHQAQGLAGFGARPARSPDIAAHRIQSYDFPAKNGQLKFAEDFQAQATKAAKTKPASKEKTHSPWKNKDRSRGDKPYGKQDPLAWREPQWVTEKSNGQSFTKKSCVGDVRTPPVTYDQLPPPDLRPVLLFDLNGTLTSHTADRYSAGRNLMRPGVEHLRRLQKDFRLGIFSSASDRTVSAVVPMLEQAAGPGLPLFSDKRLILHRGHTEKAPAEHIENGGNVWDTVKPLSKFFSNLRQVLLVDDDAYKSCPGEEENMILIPSWEETPDDSCLDALVTRLLQALDGMNKTTDLRMYSHAVSVSLLYQPVSKACTDPNELSLEPELLEQTVGNPDALSAGIPV